MTEFRHKTGVLVFTFSILCITKLVHAQWEAVEKFPARINTIHFLEDAGRAEIGFVGLANGDVFKSTDQGRSWIKFSTVPVNWAGNAFSGVITDFAFETPMHGWCSAETGLFETFDGGKTWPKIVLTEIVASVEYNNKTGLLHYTPVSKGLSCSIDKGQTYVPVAGQGSVMRGIIFSGSSIGIATTYDYTALRTTDGGYSWISGNLFHEAWQPCVIKGSNTFYAISEPFIGTNVIYRTSDGGLRWDSLFTFPISDRTTGTIGVRNTTLLVQTLNNGFFKSEDGYTWKNICGPSNIYDSRFCISGSTIFAGDHIGGLWRNSTSDPGYTSAPKVQFSTKQIDLVSTFCQVPSEKVYFGRIINCLEADSLHLVKVTCTQSAGSFTIDTYGPIPRTVESADSIGITYVSAAAVKELAKIMDFPKKTDSEFRHWSWLKLSWLRTVPATDS